MSINLPVRRSPFNAIIYDLICLGKTDPNDLQLLGSFSNIDDLQLFAKTLFSYILSSTLDSKYYILDRTNNVLTKFDPTAPLIVSSSLAISGQVCVDLATGFLKIKA